MTKSCSIEGCGRPARSRGWCLPHYNRWHYHGDPHEGRMLGSDPKKGEVQRYFREIVLKHEIDECLFWPYSRDDNGYGQMRVNGRLQSVSNLVCREVHGEPPTPEHESAHSCDCGDQGCVAKRHVEWKTHAENMADMAARGRSNCGERHPNARLTEADVREIRALRGKMKGYEIAEKFGINAGSISAIQKRKLWQHVA